MICRAICSSRTDLRCVMKSNLHSPIWWILFGFFGFPIFCIIAEFIGWFAMLKLGPAPKSTPEFGWGGAPGLFLGAPLGLVSAVCARCWRGKLYGVARFFAFAGGTSIGGVWLFWLLDAPSMVWLGDFGFAVTPLIWAGALILFALLARMPTHNVEF